MTSKILEKLWQNRIQFSILSFLTISIIFYQSFDWIFFSNSCPNIRNLGWDPVSRFLVSLNLADGLRNGFLWVPFVHIFDSPTWPAIRSLLEAFFILVYSADPIISIFITKLTETILLIFVATLILFKTDNWVNSILYFLVFVLLYFSIPAILLYSYSGMLEIQGAFFMIMAVSSFVLYQKDKSKILFPVSVFLLLQTKYPYVMMFLLAFTIYLPLQYSKEIKNIIEIFRKEIKSHLARNIRLLFLPIPLVLYVLGKFTIINWSPKESSYLIYSIVLLLILDIVVFLYRNRTELNLRASQVFYFIKWIFLPSIVWLVIHPDRFIATSNTVLLEQGESTVFFYLQTLTNDIFFVYPLFLILTISMAFNYWKFKNEYFLHLSFVSIFFFLIIVIALSFSSSNRQERHILHLYPLLLLGFVLSIDRSLSIIPWKKSKNAFLMGIIILLLFFIGKNALYKYNNFIMKDGSKFTNKFMPRIHCYAGNKSDVRAVPNWVKKEAADLIQDSSIVINQLPSYHINKPDSDLELSIHIYNFKSNHTKSKFLINPKSRHKINPTEYRNIISLGNECIKSENLEIVRNLEDEIKIIPITQKMVESEGINPSACLQLFQIKLL